MERHTRSSAGYSLLELMFVAGLLVTLSAIAVPQVLMSVDAVRSVSAARYMSTRLQRARMEAVVRSARVAMRFVQTATGYEYTVYLDGNGNGVRAHEIQQGVDVPIVPTERLTDHFVGVDFGVLPAVPAVDAGSLPPGSDPIRLGSSNIVTFSAIGTSSTGSLYIRGLRDTQYVIRVFGDTGKTRVLRFNPYKGRWEPL